MEQLTYQLVQLNSLCGRRHVSYCSELAKPVRERQQDEESYC